MSTHDDLGRTHPVATRVGQLRIREGRARRIGLAISVVVHVAFVALYSGIAGPPLLSVNPRDADGPSDLGGLELLNLTEIPDEEPEEIERPEEPEIPVERTPIPIPVATPVAAEGGDPGDAAEAAPARPEGMSAAERLRVRTADERLWDFSEIEWATTDERRIRAELAWRIGLWADSVALALERERGITDWTWTDEEGNRWGFSPGRIHLGSITLPNPFGFGSVPRILEDYLDQQYVDETLQRNALSGLILETWQDRNEAIRRRRDAERAEQLQNSGPRRAVPDSTRSGGGGG